MNQKLAKVKAILFTQSDNYRGKAIRILIVSTILTFLLPIYIAFTNHVWIQHSAFWIIHTDPFFSPPTIITFYDPISTFVYWLPMFIVSLISYRFIKSQTAEKLYYIIQVISITILLFLFVYLDYAVNSWPSETMMIPFPYASILALTISLKAKRPNIDRPWQESEV